MALTITRLMCADIISSSDVTLYRVREQSSKVSVSMIGQALTANFRALSPRWPKVGMNLSPTPR
jgi:hypothetical protein